MKVVNNLRVEKRNQAAIVISRFFKYIQSRKKAIERAAKIRALGVVIIQKHVRRFVVSQR